MGGCELRNEGLLMSRASMLSTLGGAFDFIVASFGSKVVMSSSEMLIAQPVLALAKRSQLYAGQDTVSSVQG